jgi:hypothetical protein
MLGCHCERSEAISGRIRNRVEIAASRRRAARHDKGEPMSRKEIAAASVAEAYLALLAERGIEYLFANAGTDFAPIVEAYAKAAHSGLPAPKPLIATHENLAMSMAHGYAVASGKVPAVPAARR